MTDERLKRFLLEIPEHLKPTTSTAFDAEAALERYRLDLTAPVDPPRPYLHMNGGMTNFTEGNFSMIIAPQKAAKSIFAGCCLAGAIGKSTISCISSAEPGIRGILIDSEQGDYHLTKSANRIIRQTGTTERLTVYGLRPLRVDERIQLIEKVVQSIDKPTFLVIDGIRDLVRSINDEQEATAINEMLLRWTYSKPLHIMIILHMNKTDRNARGHVGTEAQNKAETVIEIDRDKNNRDLFSVSAKNTRDVDFPPFCFTIHENGLPYLTEAETSGNARKLATMRENFEAILPGLTDLDYTSLVKEYMVISGAAERTAKRHVADAIKNKILLKNGSQCYCFNQREY